MLSTLRRYLEAMGGELNLIVEFKDCPSVKIMELIDLEEFTD
jgi:hypothetical protein